MFTITYSVGGGGWGIRTLVPVKANGFQDRLVMTTSIILRAVQRRDLRSGSVALGKRIHCAVHR